MCELVITFKVNVKSLTQQSWYISWSEARFLKTAAVPSHLLSSDGRS